MLLKLGKLGSICSHYPSPDADTDMSALGDRLEQTALHVVTVVLLELCITSDGKRQQHEEQESLHGHYQPCGRVFATQP